MAAAASATQMGLMMEHREFDLIVLDIGLPDIDGFEVTREIRRTSQLPIIVLTARDEVFDRIVGLEMGADDYVTKPFEPRELLARIKSVLRRAKPTDGPSETLTPAQKLQFAGFTLDTVARDLLGAAGEAVPLTSTEFSLLRALAERPGEVLSRERILEVVYGNAIAITDRAIDAHIARLRRKLETQEPGQNVIRTVHGVGYTLAVAVQAD